jgi:glutathione S-transferase
MITLYAFKSIFEGGVGETKDLRAQWTFEETGLPYRVHALDQVAGDLQSEAHSKLSPFHQLPVIDDDGFVLSESGAIVLYIARRRESSSRATSKGASAWTAHAGRNRGTVGSP